MKPEVTKMEKEKDELFLLERVFLRLGSCETDEQLQSNLAKFLVPCLSKISSEFENVRKKVMELLTHINKRVKSRPKIQLPVDDLLKQYMSPDATAFITNFTILYVKMGVSRLPPEQQGALVPTLFNCLEGKPKPQQDCILQLMITAIQYMKIPEDPAKSKVLLPLQDKPQLTKNLLAYMLDALLLPYGWTGQKEGAPTMSAPPGLTTSSYKALTAEGIPEPDALEKIKIGLLKLLGANMLPEHDVVCLYTVATADARHNVAETADKELKRISGSVDWNNMAVISKLFAIYQGTVVVKGKPSPIKPEHIRLPVNIRVKLKIFPYFLRSSESANHFPACIQVLFDALFGTDTNAKLKSLGVQYVHHICLHASDAKFNPIAGVLMNGMIKLVKNSSENSNIRGRAYVAVGKIGKRAPNLVSKDIALLQQFFDAITKEEGELKLAIQEALSMMSSAFKDLSGTNCALMEALILQNIEKVESQARLMSVQYASNVFPSYHIPSTYVLLLAAGDSQDDIRTEAIKALYGVGQNEGGEKHKDRDDLPDFSQLVVYLAQKGEQRIKTSSKYEVGSKVLPFNPNTYTEIIRYCRLCLANSSGVKVSFESLSEERKSHAPSIGKYVGRMLEGNGIEENNAIHIYSTMLQQFLSAVQGEDAMYCLLELVSVAKGKLSTKFVDKLPWIKNLMFNNRDSVRDYAAELYAVIVSVTQDVQAIQLTIEELNENMNNKSLEVQHGSILALGHMIANALVSEPTGSSSVGDVTMEDLETPGNNTGTTPGTETNGYIVEAVHSLVKQVGSSQALLACGACLSLGEIGRRCPLPLPDGSKEDTQEDLVTKLSLVKKLIKIVQATKETIKVRERASFCLGYMCIGDSKFPHRQVVMDGLVESAQNKEVELHLSIGDALVCVAQGNMSPLARNTWLEDATTVPPQYDCSLVETLVKLILTKYVTHASPHVRQCACIWLLSVMNQCAKQTDVQKHLGDIQVAFMTMLSDKDEVTQDLSSKGLSLVYENSGEDQRSGLVSSLVDTLMTGKRPQMQVTQDTELFAEGALGKTPDGANMSTYKELCSIANDLNQPDLIYKFMHLANHSAMWNSKKGAAFGFKTIAAQAGEQLAPILHKIVPRLYRYQFDPNPRINQAMTSIWNALVSDTKKTVDKYLGEILSDVVQNLTNTQWRVRESSCFALNELLRRQQLDDVIGELPNIWEILFRVMDDIKESVRTAADVAVKTLSRVSIRLCDVDNGKLGEKAIIAIIPSLLNIGLASQVKEVRNISLKTIVEISKKSGKLLKPHVPLLTGALLESLSGLENQALNYVSLQYSSSQESQDLLDKARIAASKSSPMMETINRGIQFVDAENLPELVAIISKLAKSGIGLGTKAGCCHVIVSLTRQCGADMTPLAGKLLSNTLHMLQDKSGAIRKSAATAIGHLVKVAKESSVEKVIVKLKTWYLEKDDENLKKACGVTLAAINHNAPDVLQRHATLALPMAFFAKHEKKKEGDDKAGPWEDVWNEATPGTAGGLRLYLKEIVELVENGIKSQSWDLKAQSASTMASIAESLGTSLVDPHLTLLLVALMNGLPGRTWTGKEILLQALSSVYVSCRETIQKSENKEQPSPDIVVDALLKECKKENVVYKTAALKCTGEILEAYEIDRYGDILEILNPLLNPSKGDTEDDDKDDKNARFDLQCVAFECLGQAWPKQKVTQDTHQCSSCALLSERLTASSWKVQIAIVKTLNKLIDRLLILEDDTLRGNHSYLDAIITSITPSICICLGNIKYAGLRKECLGVLETLTKKLSKLSCLDILPPGPCAQLRDSLKALENDSQPELKHKALDLYKIIPNKE
ncbi:unnamed protein product [Owenia fusiformis]|uniref:Proteasome-associated protein ECM29 homolog n=1 Tax=Owenia fusiformis TaxID=6347 RepID=A0A8S4N2E3_OWEFU|nr:unnamed protein product [Owenia fusiformis]